MKLSLHKDMSNQEIADVFNFISGIIALHDTSPWRARAYQNAAAVIEQLDTPLLKCS